MLTRYMQREVVQIAELAEPPSPHAGLFDVGVDSLTALALKGRLERETGLILPDTLAFEQPTIAALVELLLDGLDRANGGAGPS
jgi:acyl carrier protein